ncbi:DNA repair protein, putative [Trypanosoma brucei gambiense DAL972]|uniref:DNA repair protein, putative n=1 Tax=Trypanosoma brucei gambiense (strain MHOM/CI/86/DAL972) TaxID=679716 RepID=D0A5K9_TRYB9|nr:DNA repair protein, putative [Trypanosoma brucei gambiense DAL972]CBH16960.1 DNA repair protein, putative [Trypanosoma brucei gambiense DAL972]|eukprot:XP_011779224.1 DNA repair protein, putative [Trypanosoma brucei gambiense DAL972]
MTSKHSAVLTITEKGDWRTAKNGEKVWRYMVQTAPTMRARCRKCSQPILKGDLKWGTPIRHSHGAYGWITAWHHVGCTRIAERKGFSDIVHGIDLLPPEKRAQVVAEVTSDSMPEHLLPLNPDDLVKKPLLPETEAPAELLRPLLRYQKEGLGWMVSQELSQVKGGILADEMGMGKTIQMISLFLARRLVGPTLVVCPVSSMLQWESEVKDHVVSGSLSVVVVSRTKNVRRDDIQNADVVLTTYPMLEQSWRELVNKKRVPCPYCQQLYLPRQLVVHNRYFCGPHAKKTSKQAKREKRQGGTGSSPTRKVQAKETIMKGLRTLRVDVDDNAEEGEDSVFEEGPRGIVGPMGLYRELMVEAGRKVRSRWDPAYVGSDSSGDTNNSTTESSTSSERDDSEEVLSKEEVADDKLSSFRCLHCGFQLLRYPFCPKIGQCHVLSDYMKQIIETDDGSDGVDLSQSVFHSVTWSRIVLDEAHRIKGSNTSTSRAAFALVGEHRWCLTGTPLQNRVGDVYSLVRFLRLAPYARYYCGTEGCSCSSFSHPFSGNDLRHCIFCGHGPVQHYAYFNRHILNPIIRYGYVGDGRRGMMMLSNEILQKCMLRRTKAERASDLHLPPMTVETFQVKLTDEERSFYESLYKKSTAAFDTFVEKGTVLHNYAHIFQLLSRLRQALDHPLIVINSMNVGGSSCSKGVCGICTESCEENSVQVDPCKHTFHRICLSQFVESQPLKEYNCPVCYVAINIDLRSLHSGWDEDGAQPVLPPELVHSDNESDENNVEEESKGRKLDDSAEGKSARARSVKKRGILSRIDSSRPLRGTKLDAITEYICSIPEEEKVIVFSQFGDTLDLIQLWLQKVKVKTVKLVGSLMLSQRQAVLRAFLHDKSVRAILISLKAGGEGLNLQIANHVVLVDPWWNPAVEMQAAQRAHRIGQTRPVRVVRFVTERSVEERMLELQEKKMLVIEGTIDGKVSSLQSLSEDDLQFLFTR